MRDNCGPRMPLSIWGLGMALGITWVICMLLIFLMNFMGIGFTTTLMKLLGMVYGSTGQSGLGIVFGILWSFLDGFITGVVIAFFYNCALCCWPCKRDNQINK